MERDIKLLHILDLEWERQAARRYGKAYPELQRLFAERLITGFRRTYLLADETALRYLIGILVKFLPLSVDENTIIAMLDLTRLDLEDPESRARLYESAGEIILWYSGLCKRDVFCEEGQRSFREAYLILKGGETSPSERSKIDRMFAKNFTDYRSVLEHTELLEETKYLWFKSLFRKLNWHHTN